MIRSQQLRFMVYTLIAFTILFGIFGTIIFGQIKATLYAKTDSDLNGYKRMIETVARGAASGEIPDRDLFGGKRVFFPGKGGRLMYNPRVLPIQWENGKIMNPQQIGLIYYDHYLSHLEFDPSTIGVISNIKIGGKYFFRTMTILHPTDGQCRLRAKFDQ
ncbi:hypothetical protein [Paenibacillus azoreducens]|nr:hypothetical protein [Paenibacillus azoreducens]